MAVRKSGEQWVVEFMFRGIRIFKRLPKGATAAQARLLEGRLRNQIFVEVDLGKRQDPPLRGVIDEWVEERVRGRKAEKQTVNHANAVKGALDERQTLSGIAGCRNRLVALWRDLSPSTLNRRLCILKAVAKFAYQKGYLQENLSAKIQLLPENNARHVYLTQTQVDSLVQAAHTDEAKAFIAIAAYTGLRQSEVMALTPNDITAQGLVVRDSKIGQPRIVPYLGDKLHLRAVPFTSHKRTLYSAFEAARDSLGLHGLRYHDLRHTTASLLINSGADLYIVKNILGHRSSQTTSRYAHLSVDMQRAALERAFPIKITKTAGNKGRKKQPK